MRNEFYGALKCWQVACVRNGLHVGTQDRAVKAGGKLVRAADERSSMFKHTLVFEYSIKSKREGTQRLGMEGKGETRER